MNTPESYASTAALEAGLSDVQTSPRDSGRVIQIIRRPDRDLRELPSECELTPAEGMKGDYLKAVEATLAAIRRVARGEVVGV